jgi:RNA polymerase-binding transcription factor DksA
MDISTQNHLTMLRNLLEYRLSDARASAHAAQEEARRWQDETRGVEAALQRLDDGVYGDCAECGRPIGLQRLLVMPEALACGACEAAHAQAPALAGPPYQPPRHDQRNAP